MSRSLEQVLAERDFLLDRAEAASRMEFGPHRWTGVSSNALVRCVFRGGHPLPDEYPADPSDLMACYRTVHRLPSHLRQRGREILSNYRAAMEKEGHYPLTELDALVRKEGVEP